MAPKLKRVTRIDSIPAGSTSFDEQGFLHDAPIVTTTGIFEYALPDGGVRRELRLPEHVFEKESLASYAGKPVIITHDAGSIDKNNVMKEIVGTILSDGYQDGNNVRCKIVIHDIDKVKKIPYRELSLGYSLDLIEEPGTWNGEPYDAIQTNIRVNHLAIVENARAGEQAHLNLDEKKKRVESDDRQNKEGGKKEMHENEMHNDGIDMTPEELIEAIKAFKASKGENNGNPDATKPAEAEAGADGSEEKEVPPTDVQRVPATEPDTMENPVKEIEKHDGKHEKLISLLEGFLAELKNECSQENPVENSADSVDEPQCGEGNGDSSDDMSCSMNNDSGDDIVMQKLSICRVGDKLNMDGLESKSIIDGKKAIIAKVLPNIRLDGKGTEYINAAYDMAVAEVSKRKGVAYQRQQMTSNAPRRMDGKDNVSMASSARQRMLEREGGNE